MASARHSKLVLSIIIIASACVGAPAVDGVTVLLSGVDTIAGVYGESVDLEPLFDHELFHMYHETVAPFPEADGDGPDGLLVRRGPKDSPFT